MSEDVRKAIDGLFEVYFEGLRKEDVASVVALYAEDAVQLPPSRDIVRGRNKVKEETETTVQGGIC